MAIDTPGHLLAIQVTTATAQERAKVHLFLAQEVHMSAQNRSHWPLSIKDIPGRNLRRQLGRKGRDAIYIIKRQEAKKGCVLHPGRWPGRRAEFWLGLALATIDTGLSAITQTLARAAFCRLHHPHTTQCRYSLLHSS